MENPDDNGDGENTENGNGGTENPGDNGNSENPENGNSGAENPGDNGDDKNPENGNDGTEEEGGSNGAESETHSDSEPTKDSGNDMETTDETARVQDDVLLVQSGVFVMPIYLSEPVDGAEPQTMEKEKESVMIKGVTWQSEPAYDGNVEGSYTFTAILPEDYALADGTSLPQITVTVQGEDPMVQELLTRVAALPEAEAYLADEPDVDEEDEYEAWMDEISAYVEEALAIREAYEALTAEQQARIPQEALDKLTAWVELAEQLAEGSQVMAAADETGGTFGDGLTWKLEGNTLTISGSGAMPDWVKVEDTPWYGSRGDVKSVIIENGVTNIGSHAFLNCSALTSVTIAGGVTSIGDKAFYDCISLTSVTIPNNVTSIGSSVFQNCKNLLSVTFIEGGSIPTLGWGCFFGCPCITGTGRGLSIPSCSYLKAEGWEPYKENVTVKEPHKLTHAENNAGKCLTCSVCGTQFSEKITAENCDVTTAVAGESYTVTFTPNSGYAVPTEVTVTIGGTALVSGDYTYEKSSAAGKLTIPIGEITGDVIITATAEVAQITIEVTLKKDGSPWGGQTVTLKKDGATYEVNIGGSGIYRFKVPKGGMYGIYVNNQSTGIDINTDQNYDNFHETLYYLTMTYNANGADGTVPPKRDCSCGRKESSSTWQHSVDKTLPMRKQGCVQIGWSEASDGSSGIAEIIVVNDGKGNVRETPVTLYPVFAPAKVTITAENCTHNGATEVAASGDYTVTFTPKTGYDVPAGVTVEIGGTALGSDDYTYTADNKFGKLTIPRNQITGNITITVTAAQHSHSLTYTADETADTITESCDTCDNHTAVATFSESGSCTYTGSEITPFVVRYPDESGGASAWLGAKPEITYANNTEVSYVNGAVAEKATAILSVGGASVSRTFKIEPKPLTDSSITAVTDATEYPYTGQPVTPPVTVCDTAIGDGRTLRADTDYTVAYKDNTAVSTDTVTAQAVITGKGNYTEKRIVNFTIKGMSVTKPVPGGAGAGKPGNEVTGGESSADGGEVTYTGTCSKEYTPVITVGGNTYTPEIKWNGDGTGTWTVTVPASGGAPQVNFNDRIHQKLSIEPSSLRIYADSGYNKSLDTLVDALTANCVVKAEYDNGTSDVLTNGPVYKTQDTFSSEKSGTYRYTVEAVGETGHITLTVSPVNAAVSPQTLTKPCKADGYTEAEIAGFLPAEVMVTYTGDGYTTRTERRAVTWTTDSLGAELGKTKGSKKIDGKVTLPAWATGNGAASITLNFTDESESSGDSGSGSHGGGNSGNSGNNSSGNNGNNSSGNNGGGNSNNNSSNSGNNGGSNNSGIGTTAGKDSGSKPGSAGTTVGKSSGSKPGSDGTTVGKNSGSTTGKGSVTGENSAGREAGPQQKEESAGQNAETGSTEAAGQDGSSQPRDGGARQNVQTVKAAAENGRIVIPEDTAVSGATGSLTEDDPASTKILVGEGSVVVTVVCEDENYTAGTKDAAAVANAILTPEQIALVENGETLEVRVDIRDISGSMTSQEMAAVEKGYQAYEKYYPDLTLGGYVDISVYMKVGNSGWSTVAETKEPIEVVIGIPEKLRGDDRAYYIIRTHEGRYTLLNDMDDVPDTITVLTDQFSSYVIAYRLLGTEEAYAAKGRTVCGLCHICPTFLGICCYVWLAVIVTMIFAGAAVFMVLRRKQEMAKV